MILRFHLLRLSTLLCFLLATLSLNAQEIKQVQWGKQDKTKKHAVVDKIISQDATGFYVLKLSQGNWGEHEGPSEAYIQHFDRKMNLTKSEKLDLKWERKRRQFEDILMIGGELYLFSSFNNSGKKKNFLFAQKLDKKTLKAEEEKPNYIAEIDSKSKHKEGNFNFRISKDSSKLLILNNLPYKKNDPEKFAFYVYNNDLTLIWKKDIQLPYEDKNFAVEDYQIDNEGNAYLMGVLYEDNKRISRRKGLPNYQYILLAYTNKGTEKEKYPIKFKDKFITDLIFGPSNTGELVCSGFYSERGTFSIRGTYFFRINLETKEVFNKSLKEFDFDFRTEYASKRKKEKLEKKGKNKKAELYEYSLDKLILKNNGGALLVAEQFYSRRQREYINHYNALDPRFSANRQFADVYTYYFNDIIVVNIGPDGAIEWTNRIPKRQETENDFGLYSSYAMSIVGNQVCFIYNDNRKNLDPTAKKRKSPYQFTAGKSEIALSQISPDGTVSTKIINKNIGHNILIQPGVCKQTGPKEIVIYTYTRNASLFGRIDL